MPGSTSSKTAGAAVKRKNIKAPGIRQTMSDLHIWVGLLAGWILYAMFLTGTVSYFRDEISQWMRPDIPAQAQVVDAAEFAPRLISTLQSLAPASPQWGISLPDARNNTASAFWRGGKRFENATFDPATAQPISVRDSVGGEFFYRFHFQLHYFPVLWGRWIAGLCGMFMLVAIISGVITHKKIFIDFFTFRWGKGQRSWLDAHNALSVFGLPFHLMITYTGLVTLMLMYMPWGSDAAFKEAAQRQAMQTELSAFMRAGPPTGRRAELAPVAGMVEQAQARWGRDGVGRINVNNPGDESARVIVVRADNARVSTSPQYMVFDGVGGQLLHVKDRVGAAAETRGVMYGLHLGRFSDYPLRWLYFLVSLAGTAMVGTGLVLWTVKRRARLPEPTRPHFGFRLVERLNIASIAGLSVAMAAFLWGNRLLPEGMASRKVWEVDLLFIVWGATLLYALARPAKRAWAELLWLAAALLALLPLLNGLTTERHLLRSMAAGDWVFAGFDLTLMALGGLHAVLALRSQRHQPKARPIVARKPRCAPPAAVPPVALHGSQAAGTTESG
ncbi:MAG: PepSY-associated TM helix domain-containing protein [Pusillimonas sp.]